MNKMFTLKKRIEASIANGQLDCSGIAIDQHLYAIDPVIVGDNMRLYMYSQNRNVVSTRVSIVGVYEITGGASFGRSACAILTRSGEFCMVYKATNAWLKQEMAAKPMKNPGFGKHLGIQRH